MRRLAIILLSTVAFGGFSAGAEAADKPVLKAKPIRKAPPPESTGGSGFYVGINGGYDWGRASFSNFTGTSSTRIPSGLVGLTLGYNAQSGSFVYGLETDIDYAWLKDTNWSVPPCFGCEVRLTYFRNPARTHRLCGGFGPALFHRRFGLRRRENCAHRKRDGQQSRMDGRRQRRIRHPGPLVGKARVSLLRTRQGRLLRRHLRYAGCRQAEGQSRPRRHQLPILASKLASG